MNIETELRQIYQTYKRQYGDNCRLRMSHANCIKLVLEMAARARKPYKVILNQIEDQVWYDWPQQIKRDTIREKFLAWGGQWVSQAQAGDLLFICLRYTPVDHLGLCLNTDEFVHLGRKGLCLERIDDFEQRIIAVGRV